MENKKPFKLYAKTLLAGVVVAISATFLTPMAAQPAFAAGCGGPSDFGCGTDAGTAPGPGPVTGTDPVQGPPAGNTGGGVSDGSTWKIIRRVPDSAGGSMSCPRRDDGKAALGADYYYKLVDAVGADRNTPPDNTGGWRYTSYYPGYGYYFEKFVYVSKSCLYPPRTYLTTANCVISSTATVDMTAPSRKRLATATSGSGYNPAAPTYSACVNSKSNAKLGVKLTEYGAYVSTAVSTAQIATVEVAVTPNEVTGITPIPKIVSLSAPYQMTPKQATGSLDCKTPWSSPAVYVSDWTDEPCSGTNSTNPSYICSVKPVLFDIADGNAELLRSGAGNRMQFMRDGKARSVTFNQTASGKGISVNSYSTQFLRSGTPWDSSALYNKNSFELSRTKTGATILSRTGGSGTPTLAGSVNTVFATGYSASDSGAPTLLTQKLKWSGTRTISSATITGIDGRTGAMTVVRTSAQVPTSGSCSQTATLEYIRAIGDVVR